MTNALTLEGNLAGDPELRYTASGRAVANFTVCHTPRVKQGDEYVDGETIFMRCTVWQDHASNVAESLSRGVRVVVTGRLRARTYETPEGEKRTVFEMDVDSVGPTLKFATARVTKTTREAAAPRLAAVAGGVPSEPPF